MMTVLSPIEEKKVEVDYRRHGCCCNYLHYYYRYLDGKDVGGGDGGG
jgi:hypothetical protein